MAQRLSLEQAAHLEVGKPSEERGKKKKQKTSGDGINLDLELCLRGA